MIDIYTPLRPTPVYSEDDKESVEYGFTTRWQLTDSEEADDYAVA
jgi:hypothetical protein